jgi:cytidylate kinase
MERALPHWFREQNADGEVKATTTRFTIAISRQAGARGHAVARCTAERLHWPVYDHELLEAIAAKMGLREQLLASVDEKHMGWVQETVERLCALPQVTEKAYVRRLVPMLFSLASHGDCLIVGRGAAQVLPPATTLRVRLVGPFQERVANVQRRLAVSHSEATHWVKKTDRDRDRFVRDHFQKDASDPEYYDLVLNSCRFSDTECADVIIATLHALQQQPRRLP